ncbi:MAG: radical SAM protein [Desulfobacterales bacterium]
MRFLLVNPYYPIAEGPSPPLGIAFLGAALERAGVEVKVLDLVVYPYSKMMLESVLDTFDPHFVGSTAVTMSFDNAIQVISDVKSINPKIYTVMGGPHVTFCARETMEAFPELDFVVLGEGEETIVDLIKMSENGRKWNEIRGVAYRDGSSLHCTDVKKTSLDVDSLPLPARHLLPLGRYRALNMPISLTTSRGCPFKCIFCVGRKMVGANVRYRSAKPVVDEMESLHKLGFPQINVADDLFTANKKHCIEICDEILDRGLAIKWSSFARVDTVSPEVMKKMKEAGCYSVSFGVETANAEILKTIRKGITISQVIDAVKICNDAGIQPSASFILGLPGETPETLKETVEFGKKLKKMGVIYGFHLLAPFPGTRIREEAEAYGIRILTNDWREYHANRAIVETASVKKNMLDEIAIEWEEDINKWLGHLNEMIKNGSASEEEAFPLENLERTVIAYDLMMGDILKDYGSWHREEDLNLSDTELIKKLVSRIPESFDHPRNTIEKTLNYSKNKGNLSVKREEGRIEWEWVDYLNSF